MNPLFGEYTFWSSSAMSSDDSNINYVLVQTHSGDRVAECHYSSSSLCEKNSTYNKGIIIKIIDKSVMIKNLPPVVGEYGYFDSRKTKNTIWHRERR